MTAALDGDKAYAEALAKKGNLLSGEQALAAVANFDIAERLVVLQSCELAQAMKLPNQIEAMKLPNQIGSVIRPKVLENEISKLCNAQQEFLSVKPRKIDAHNASHDVLSVKPRKIDAHNASHDVLSAKPRKIDAHNASHDVLSAKPRKIDAHNALILSSGSKVMEAFNTSLSNVAKNHALNQSQNVGLSLWVGNVISQTAAANNSVMLNKGPKIDP